MAAEKRRLGRPPLAVRPARVHVTVPGHDYDRVYQLARQQAVSVPEIVRRGIARVLRRP
jgi:hypothetical protein